MSDEPKLPADPDAPAPAEAAEGADIPSDPKDAILRQIPIFANLSPQQILKVRESIEEVSIRKNTMIFKEGDTGDALYVIVDGKVKMVKKIEDGSDKTVAVFRDGDFFGEMALIEETPRSATAIVIDGDASLYKISKQNFSYLMRLNPQISLKIMKFMSERMRQSSTSGPVAEKEAKVLTFFSPKGGVGQSLLAVNVAAALKKNPDNKVLLIDLDLEFSGLQFLLNLTAPKTLVNLVQEVKIFSYDNIAPFINKTPDGIHVMIATGRTEEAELVQVSVIKEVLEVLAGHYDFILIDTSRTYLSDINLFAMDKAWRLIYVITNEFLTVMNTMRGLEVLKSLEYPTERVVPVLNMFHGGEKGLKLEAIEQHLKTKVEYTIPYDYDVARGCVDNGGSVIDRAPESPLAAGVIEFVNKLCKQSIPAPKAAAAKDIVGMFKGFFGK